MDDLPSSQWCMKSKVARPPDWLTRLDLVCRNVLHICSWYNSSIFTLIISVQLIIFFRHLWRKFFLRFFKRWLEFLKIWAMVPIEKILGLAGDSLFTLQIGPALSPFDMPFLLWHKRIVITCWLSILRAICLEFAKNIPPALILQPL